MSNNQRLDPHKNPNVVWERRTSKNGKPYMIGRPKSDGASSLQRRGKRAFSISVDWPVAEQAAYSQTSTSFRNLTAITRYGVWKYPPGSFYMYQINFTNLEHYDYYFTDDTGDIYECDTFRNGDHYISYDSYSPSINFIKGS